MSDAASIEVAPFPGGSSARVAQLPLRSSCGNERTVVFRQHLDRSGKGHDTVDELLNQPDEIPVSIDARRFLSAGPA
jgi:hypothetical protein